MIVGIAGKIHDEPDGEWLPTASPEKFRNLCVHLGRRLGHHGHRVVVRSARGSTADRNVVDGYLKAFEMCEPSRRADLRVIVTGRSRTEPHAYRDFEDRYPGLFMALPSQTPRPRSEHLIACTRCHATICLGGGERTEQIGHAVLAARRHLVPVASCGGASESLCNFAARAARDAAFLPVRSRLRRCASRCRRRSCESRSTGGSRTRHPGPTVVVIHGHDTAAVKTLKDVLQGRCGLPDSNVRLMIDAAPSAATYAEKWERIAREATAAIVLATPDDEGGVRDRSQAVRLRARQNVWLEFGWMWSFLRRRDRLLYVTRVTEHGDSIEAPSDVDAVERVVF